ncbi:hypothetical protein FRC12_007710, partial [Ceratobasidium sp. 428]
MGSTQPKKKKKKNRVLLKGGYPYHYAPKSNLLTPFPAPSTSRSRSLSSRLPFPFTPSPSPRTGLNIGDDEIGDPYNIILPEVYALGVGVWHPIVPFRACGIAMGGEGAS